MNLCGLKPFSQVDLTFNVNSSSFAVLHATYLWQLQQGELLCGYLSYNIIMNDCTAYGTRDSIITPCL